jgi:alpha-tubulin suppressor-like RCC1 family protein
MKTTNAARPRRGVQPGAASFLAQSWLTAGWLLASAAAAPAQIYVGFEPWSFAAAENSGAVTLRVLRWGDTNQPVAVDYATSDGSATADVDYRASSGTLTFGPGETEQIISIPILNDLLPEPAEGFSVVLFNPTADVSVSPRIAYVSILDNDRGPQFSPAGYEVQENAGSAIMTVTLSTDETSTVTVDYASSYSEWEFAATPGEDYVPVSGTLTFAPGVTSQSFTIPVLNDGLTEGDEYVFLTLSNVSGVTSVGPVTNAWLTIHDNDFGVQFTPARYSVWETSGVATITVRRDDDWPGEVTVNYATSDGSATAGADYTARSGTLHFATGETQKSFTVSILNDGLAEGAEKLNLTLSGLAGAVSFGTNTNALVTIVDDERPSDPTTRNRQVLAAGDDQTLALKTDGSLWAWGGGWSNVPVRVGSDTDWASVAAGCLALKTDGSLWQCGGVSSPPTQIGTDQDWAAVAAGNSAVLALKTDGSRWAWGYNRLGFFGDGNVWNSAPLPFQVDSNEGWLSIVAGIDHAMGLRSDGSLWGWGGNNHGQLGLGPVVGTALTPQRVTEENDWEIVVTAGGRDTWDVSDGDTLALKTDGSLWAWGANWNGQLGDGSFQSTYVPVPIGSQNDWATLAASPSHTVALKTDGSLWAWGANWAGQLGNGTWDSTNSPTRVDSDHDWVAIAAGRYHTVGLKVDGSLWVWGANGSGQLGLGLDAAVATNVPVRIGAGNDWALPAAVTGEFRITERSVGPNGRLQLAFTHTNSRAYYVLCRGPTVTNIDQPVEVRLASSLPLVLTDPTPAASNGSAFYRLRAVPLNQPLDLDADGIDDIYELRHARFLNPLDAADATQDFDGDGRSNRREYRDRSNPAQAQQWQVVAAGLYHSVVLKSDGSLWAWGDNSYGQLGDGTAEWWRAAPVRIGADNDWVSVAAGRHALGGDHTVALKQDGTLWAWGANFVGQLGLGASFDMTNVPVRVGTERNWAAVAAGDGFTVALKTDGTLWGWGINLVTSSNLGFLPRQISYDWDWRAVAVGGGHALALKKDGSLWAWGDNWVGQCGLGTDGPSGVTVVREWTRVGTDTDWTAVAASGDGDWFDGTHSLALKADGSLWAWGHGARGELGLGPVQFDMTVPTRVGAETNWMGIAASCGRSLARQRDGTLWAWGGELGDRPVLLDGNRDWRSFTCGGPPYDAFILALKDEGSLWEGLPPNFTPRRIGTDTDWGTPP